MSKQIVSGVPVYLPEGMPPYTPYKDSVQMPCEACGQSCWVGPRQKALIDADPTIEVVCMVCIVLTCKAEGIQLPPIQSLGNTHDS